MKADKDDIEELLERAEAPTQKEETKTTDAKGKQPNNEQNGAAETTDHEPPSLKEVIKEQAIEGEAPFSRNLSLRKILGGDILNAAAIREQIWLFLLIAFMLIIYTSNRYSCQQDIIEIDRLQKELQDAKYKALSSNSQLTEKSRESNVLQLLKASKDSTLKIANQPPYIINVPRD